MKKGILTVVALAIFGIVTGQTLTQLNGIVTNPTGEKVYLQHTVKQENGRYKMVVLDSFKLDANGSFKLQTELKELTQCSFADENESTVVLLSPGDNLSLTLNTKMFDETIQYTGKGAEKNNAAKNIYLIKEVILNTVFSYSDDTDTTEIFDYMHESMSLMAEVIKDYQNEILDFKDFGNSQLEFIEKGEGQIKKNIVSDREFNKLISGLIGTNGINIEGVTLKGKKVNLDKYKGKTIIIDFWATWCGPCKAEMPAFKELEEKYGDDVNFVSLGLYCKEDAWIEMATDLGFKNNMYVSKEMQDQIEPWNIKFIPRYVVLDKDFKVVDALAPRPSSGDLEKLILKLNPGLK
jgi:thiol-disulfide isomerase/thioredoxin